MQGKIYTFKCRSQEKLISQQDFWTCISTTLYISIYTEGKYIFLYDDAEGNTVLTEMVIKILFIIAVLHKKQQKKKKVHSNILSFKPMFSKIRESRFLFPIQTHLPSCPSVWSVTEVLWETQGKSCSEWEGNEVCAHLKYPPQVCSKQQSEQ